MADEPLVGGPNEYEEIDFMICEICWSTWAQSQDHPHACPYQATNEHLDYYMKGT